MYLTGFLNYRFLILGTKYELPDFAELTMGGAQSSGIPGGGTEGYHVLKVSSYLVV